MKLRDIDRIKSAADQAIVFSHASNLITTCQELSSTQFFEKRTRNFDKEPYDFDKNRLVQDLNNPMSTNLEDSWPVCLSDLRMNLSNTRN